MSSDDSTTRCATLLPWDRFQNWLHCMCVVTFDLELGQAMEVISLAVSRVRAAVLKKNCSVIPWLI